MSGRMPDERLGKLTFWLAVADRQQPHVLAGWAPPQAGIDKDRYNTDGDVLTSAWMARPNLNRSLTLSLTWS
jgi:hypothetical protein